MDLDRISELLADEPPTTRQVWEWAARGARPTPR
jgi:hypothetical protein